MGIFDGLGNLRFILDTETDADSPNDEMLNDSYRQAIEALFLTVFGTGVSGTATSNPSNDTNGYFYDSGAGYTDDEHNGRTLVMTSGAAVGNHYTIDDTVASSNRLACTGDNLYSDGVRSGDAYIILYDVKTNVGHDHDDVNSKKPVLANASIVNAKLKTSTGSASGSIDAGNGAVIAMQDYCFFPNVYTGGADVVMQPAATSGDTVGRFTLQNNGVSGANYSVEWRYITSSDEPFIFAIRDKASGNILGCWINEDPPPGYWGLDKTPEDFIPPIKLVDKDGRDAFDQRRHEQIVAWKVQKEIIDEIRNRSATEKKGIHAILKDLSFDHESAKFLKGKGDKQ